MNKTTIVTVVVLALIVAGGYYFFTNNSTNVTGSVVTDIPGDTKVFVVDSSHLRFYIDGVENPDIVVNSGDKVRIEFTSSEGFHDFVIDEFGAATEKVRPGNSTSVEFVADREGTFEYYCSVGKHRQNGMFGKFIVQ